MSPYVPPIIWVDGAAPDLNAANLNALEQATADAIGDHEQDMAVHSSGRELGYAERTTDVANIGATVADVTGLSVTVTVGTRPIIVEFACASAKSDTAGCGVVAFITDGAGAEQTRTVMRGGDVQEEQTMYCRRRLALAAGSTVTYKVRAQNYFGGLGVMYAAPVRPMWLQVTEV
jgi:hypothetical protein